jgi:hypothetical protein
MFYMLVHQLALIQLHMKRASLSVVWHTLHEEQLYLFHVQLVQGYSQGIIIFATSSVDGFHIKMKMNLTFCAVYCGLIT